jgi:hypothetical protein
VQFSKRENASGGKIAVAGYFVTLLTTFLVSNNGNVTFEKIVT